MIVFVVNWWCPVIVTFIVSGLPPVSYRLWGQELSGLVQADIVLLLMVSTFLLMLVMSFKSIIGRLQVELLLSLFWLRRLLLLRRARGNIDVISTFVTGVTFHFLERALQVWQVLRNLVRYLSRFARLVVFLGKRLSVSHWMAMCGYQLHVFASLILLILAFSIGCQVYLDARRWNHWLLLLLLAMEPFAVYRFFFRNVARWFENVCLIRGIHQRRWSNLAYVQLSRFSAILVISSYLEEFCSSSCVVTIIEQSDFLFLFSRIEWLELNHIGAGWLSNRHLLLNLNALSLS